MTKSTKPPWLPPELLETVGSSEDLRSTFIHMPVTRLAPDGRLIVTTRTYTLVHPYPDA